MILKRLAALAFFLLAPGLARADEAPEMCFDRPGINTPPCTLHTGQVMAEFGALEWDHSAAPSMRDDTLTFGDTLVRIGLGGATEAQVGLGGWGHQRSRSVAAVTTTRGVGDATIGLRHGFGSEEDAKLAVQAFISLPIGEAPGGAGDWGAGFLVPVSLPLPSGFSLSMTPEVDAAVNGSGKGRHLAWGGVVGVSHALTPAVSASAEVAAYRDEDPDGASTDARAALSAAWRAGRRFQLDVELDLGQTQGAPDHALMLGVARQF
ncbi:transporter [Novosphingobium sp.]|uniref:transporter n=1 Tax=Novosphingobium sp. TaxID=1874826 RepID=UPI00301B2967